ncbi:MAG: hypothetical protein IJ373_05365 [Clostridia bacterium]|nr:hypothetical protein [Clostridia bacterium]
MKKIKKLLVSAIALMMAFSTVACGGGGGGNTGSSSSSQGGGSSVEESSSQGGGASSEEESSSQGGGTSSGEEENDYVPKKPYQLNVFSFSGGYGRAWYDALAKRYEKERAGDKIVVNGIEYDGVDVSTKFTGTKDVMSSMTNSGAKYDVWFQEQVYYNQIVKADNMFADMTDVLTETNPYETDKTLESKMTPEQQDYYLRDGKYYGIPHYAGYVGIVYNKALFETLNLYLADGYDKEDLANDPGMCFVWDATEKRTAGPDGMYDTEDDGLPTTYAEFYALCDVVKQSSLKPVAWAGKYRQEYLNWFMTALSGNHEGLEQASLNYSFDGTATNLISVTEDADGNVTETPIEDVELDAKNNGYKLASQRGKYYALDFLETLVDREWTTKSSFSGTQEQTKTQQEFVEGNISDPTERAAMMIEGCWWEMEVANSFLALEQAGAKNPKDNFAWMPLPAIDEEAAAVRAEKLKNGGKGYTLTDTHNSLCFIGKHLESNPEVYAIAKDFVQFAYTDESLAEFSIITDTTKAVQYTMTDAQKAQMSAYGRSLMTMQEQADIVYTFSKGQFYQDNEAKLAEYKKAFSARYTADGNAVDIAVDEFKKGVSAVTYFNGLYNNQKFKWDYEII